jgi:uncharacterized tellurite resistance protein B-like protein
MFRTLADMIAGLTGRGPAALADDDHRVAAAALLVHTMAVDGAIAPVERDRVARMIERAFAVDRRLAVDIVVRAERMDRETNELTDFTHLVRRALDANGRERFIAMMWEVSFADGRAHEFEETVIGRVAELLGVSPQGVAAARLAAVGDVSRNAGT